VLCPGVVATNIFSAERNRPAELGGGDGPLDNTVPDFAGGSFAPSEMADQVFDAVRADRFYVLAAQTVVYEWTKMGHDRMWEGRNPAVSRRHLMARDAGTPLV
jgi:hypothetical protein